MIHAQRDFLSLYYPWLEVVKSSQGSITKFLCLLSFFSYWKIIIITIIIILEKTNEKTERKPDIKSDVKYGHGSDGSLIEQSAE